MTLRTNCRKLLDSKVNTAVNKIRGNEYSGIPKIYKTG